VLVEVAESLIAASSLNLGKHCIATDTAGGAGQIEFHPITGGNDQRFAFWPGDAGQQLQLLLIGKR